jgi:hypothetical protein
VDEVVDGRAAVTMPPGDRELGWFEVGDGHPRSSSGFAGFKHRATNCHATVSERATDFPTFSNVCGAGLDVVIFLGGRFS